MSLTPTDIKSAGGFKLSLLPAEIVTKIFLDVCDRDLHTKRPSSSGEKTKIIHPLVLGKICQEWRSIAWTCPLLWNTIYIPLSLRKYEQQLALLVEWIDRSGDCPLRIYLEVHGGEGLWRGTDYLRGLFRLLVANSSRWEIIDIFFPKHSKGVLNTACLRVPLLQSASIRALAGLAVQLDFLKSAPNLRKLDLKRVSPRGVDCENLTHLTASFVAITDLITTLQSTTCLEFCDLQNTYGDAASVPILHVSLPHLRTLRIRNCQSSTLLPHFGVAPDIQDLEISEYNGHLSLEELSSFLERTQSRVQRLNIGSGDSLEPNELYSVLKAVGSVSSLEIQHYYAQGEAAVFSAFLDILDPDMSLCLDNDDQAQIKEDPCGESKKRPILLPNLRELGYQLPLKMTNDCLERLVDIVKRRWKTDNSDSDINRGNGCRPGVDFARLDVLQFDPFFAASQQISVLLKKEVQEGLRITFDLPLVDSDDEDP